jgi:hypothetical protein
VVVPLAANPADGNGIAGVGDEACYGDLYQWGRAKDGHESRGSGATTTLASSTPPLERQPEAGNFRKLEKALAVLPPPVVMMGVVSTLSSSSVGTLKPAGQISLTPPSVFVALRISHFAFVI